MWGTNESIAAKDPGENLTVALLKSNTIRVRCEVGGRSITSHFLPLTISPFCRMWFLTQASMFDVVSLVTLVSWCCCSADS